MYAAVRFIGTTSLSGREKPWHRWKNMYLICKNNNCQPFFDDAGLFYPLPLKPNFKVNNTALNS